MLRAHLMEGLCGLQDDHPIQITCTHNIFYVYGSLGHLVQQVFGIILYAIHGFADLVVFRTDGYPAAALLFQLFVHRFKAVPGVAQQYRGGVFEGAERGVCP